MGKIIAVCISSRKGTAKHKVEECRIITDYGLENDAHAGSSRQVSLLSYEKFEAFRTENPGIRELKPGAFGENLLVEGIVFSSLPIGTRFSSGDVLLELTQIGKTCHSGCEISKLTGACIMPREGVFARVLRGGVLKEGDFLELNTDSCFRAAVLTSSDRSYNGQREDQSGPLIQKLLEEKGFIVSPPLVLPDEEEQLYKALVRITDEEKPDVIFTTGGTGFSERDRMPEATLKASHRNAPGIAEALRALSLQLTPNAMFSRGVSVIRDKTLIINLPGSPKAVQECLSYLLPKLSHGLQILRGDAADG